MSATKEMPASRRREWQRAAELGRRVQARMECLAAGAKDSHDGAIGDWRTSETEVIKDLDRLHALFWEPARKGDQ